MKFALKFSHLCLLAALTGSAALAQQQDTTAPQQQSPAQVGEHRRHHSPEQETRRLTRQLNLSPEQAAQVEPILAARQDQMRALRTNTSTDPQTRHQQARAIAQDTRQKLNAVLTAEQREQLDQTRAIRHGHRQGGSQTEAAPGL